jgi:hypothetical protein
VCAAAVRDRRCAAGPEGCGRVGRAGTVVPGLLGCGGRRGRRGAERVVGVASHQLVVAWALRERLPRVAGVFTAGQISYRVVNVIVARTRLIKDPAAMATVGAGLAAAVIGWGALSVAKTEAAIDYWVDRDDPDALVRTELSARGRHVYVLPAEGGTGLAWIEGTLCSTDAAALDGRLDAMARAVCEADPRTFEQRRADALGALAHGSDRLACGCGDPDCAAVDAAELGGDQRDRRREEPVRGYGRAA